ncbi:MAG: hypothetical protein KDM91_01565 [Verrucomicrobiae bacterium]|nr:hypothetical protein [Verrucomicrobiae bacterium]MCP5551829.1 hypothetical protein [Akkermansiaceae bacterium]
MASRTQSTNRIANSNGENTAEENGSASDKVGAIRDILFGEQMARYELRFSELEKKLKADFDDLSAKLESAIDDLRAFMAEQSESVASASVPRSELADQLVKLADLMREGR